jgi:hypothetical protein
MMNRVYQSLSLLLMIVMIDWEKGEIKGWFQERCIRERLWDLDGSTSLASTMALFPEVLYWVLQYA